VRKLPLAQFLVGNRKTQRRADEVLSAVIVPRSVDDARSVFLKLGSRRYLVISIVMVAAIVDTDAEGQIKQARVAVGSCSAVAQRLIELERYLVNMKAERGFTEHISSEHLSVLSPIDDVRATAHYRRDAALTLVKRALEACVEDR
jgi:CO/xanthine dehydrogenase FAD-binding subunit